MVSCRATRSALRSLFPEGYECDEADNSQEYGAADEDTRDAILVDEVDVWVEVDVGVFGVVEDGDGVRGFHAEETLHKFCVHSLID